VDVYRGICTHCRGLPQFPGVKSKEFKSIRTQKTLPEAIHPLTLDSLTLEPCPVPELVAPPPPPRRPSIKANPAVEQAVVVEDVARGKRSSVAAAVLPPQAKKMKLENTRVGSSSPARNNHDVEHGHVSVHSVKVRRGS
jgi:hypothetical protein